MRFKGGVYGGGIITLPPPLECEIRNFELLFCIIPTFLYYRYILSLRGYHQTMGLAAVAQT